MIDTGTIVALSTPQGVGALAVIRLSGAGAINVVNRVFKGKDLTIQPSHTIHYGYITDGEKVVDEVMVALFRAPKSFTTEDMAEVSCHGSPYIAEQIIRLLIQHGARAAQPGEFTLRAFMHGRIDLAQAEAVADLIASNSEASHQLALNQMRGGFATQIKGLRQRLVNFTSLIELELDFSEEDVEFANRKQLIALIDEVESLLQPLIESFKLGNVIKQGVNTVIAGKPNAGKSSLLNTLLNEERAIVSDIPGTTRDTIEEVINIKGLQFRFIDTAGIRNTTDVIEQAGVDRAIEKLKQSSVYIYLFDVNTTMPEELLHEVKNLELTHFNGLIVGSKIDATPHWQNTAPFYWILKNNPATNSINLHERLLFISAAKHKNIDLLREKLYSLAAHHISLNTESTIISNMRHFEALIKAAGILSEVKTGIETGLSGELVSLELKRALEYLGHISGEVTNEEILGNIFGKFCIGK
ncbi:MAG TPA: tRNA uridine-5-carboxymethylaminomethyl(34) synthesis GTPase MnmE [Chitinophagales bacterium]|nr:tRNA uridine-5-carboxymethylaminomethyl(34) synthesis GTPase MnmE [Chitinophagales bacterium]